MRPNPDLTPTDKRNADDREPRVHEVIIASDDGIRRVLSAHPRLRAIQVEGVIYEHTHEHEGTWVYRNQNR